MDLTEELLGELLRDIAGSTAIAVEGREIDPRNRLPEAANDSGRGHRDRHPGR